MEWQNIAQILRIFDYAFFSQFLMQSKEQILVKIIKIKAKKRIRKLQDKKKIKVQNVTIETVKL